MQRLADKVRGGYTHYIQGACAPDKAPYVAQKFSTRYPLWVSDSTQTRRRKAGLNCYRWMAYLEAGTNLVHWVLLLAPSADQPDQSDEWRDSNKERLRLTGYELVKLTRPGSSKPSLSWRYTRERHDQIRNSIVVAIRTRRDTDLAQLIYSTWRSPGFHGVGEQIKKLRKLIIHEWERARSKAEVMPNIPKRFGYVRRLSDVRATWTDLMKGKK